MQQDIGHVERFRPLLKLRISDLAGDGLKMDVMTVTPNQPCTTLSDRVHAFTARSTCMYLRSLIISILLVSPPIGEHFVRSVFPYDFLICSIYDPGYSLLPSHYTY